MPFATIKVNALNIQITIIILELQKLNERGIKMKKLFRKIVSVVLASVMVLGGVPGVDIKAGLPVKIVSAAQETVQITESAGWHESAYIKWSSVSGAESYNVYVCPVGGSYTKLDKELIRGYGDYYTADALGLTAGSYKMKVAPVIGGIEQAGAETEVLTVDNYVREGFAFSANSPYGYTTGGYNRDGSINSQADIIYVTNENKDSVTVNGDSTKGVGLTAIMAYREANKITTPMVIRFLGKVEMPSGVTNYMLGIRNTQNMTIEGVGDDATVHGWGLTMKRACNIEVRNLGIMWYGGVGGDGDSLSLDTENKNVWMHNIDFFYGALGGDSDQAKGDGSIDLKSKSDYITASYNHFWDSGKACVAGGVWESKNPDDPEAKICVTYHHNWFDHSDSRHPRCVAGSVHVYNNYYDGCAKYGIGAAVQSSVFAENNYFRNVKRPMIIATQGSDVYQSDGTYASKGTLSGQTGGMIKSYGNVIITPSRFVDQNTTPDEGQIDAYTVTSRDETVPSTVMAVSGGHTYNNFDTAADFYSYTPHTAQEVPAIVTAQAGRRGGGDFKWTFTEADDANSDVDTALQTAITSYTSRLVETNVEVGEAVTETTTQSEEVTETTTSGSVSENTTAENTESTTLAPVASDVWTADMDIPSWLKLTDYTIGGNSSSHTVFTDVDTDISGLFNRYSGTNISTIEIALSSAATVTLYVAGNDNGAGKGSLTASGAGTGTYSLPGRKDSAATPFTVETTQAGTLTVTTSYKTLLYKITVATEGGNTPVEPEEKYNVTLNFTNTTPTATTITIGEETIDITPNGQVSKTLSLAKGTYTLVSSDKTLAMTPSTITVNGEMSADITIDKVAQNVIVNSADGVFIGGYATITDALNAETTVDGCKIYITPGKYNEGFDVAKSVTLEKMPDTEGEVIVYGAGGEYGGSMDGVVRVSASNVTVKNITFLNNINASYAGVEATSTGGTAAAAIISDGDNSVFEGCKFISVQDTVNIYHYSSGKPLLKQTFNNCVFYGATDFICGSSIVDYNNCEFRIFTGTLTEKADCYIFAPSQMAQWTVNGGKVTFDEQNVVQNFYYARPWEDRSDNSQTLNIYGMEHNVKLGTKGLMGFGGPTGGGRSHSVNDFSFNVYAGADNTSELIATSNVTAIDLFEMNEATPVIEFETANNALIVGDFGKGMGSRFIENVLQDITEVGFVSEANASAEKITDTNTIKTTILYETITTKSGSANALKAVPQAQEGVYFGTGILEDIANSGSVTVVPYIKFDAVHNSDTIDIKPIYKFGTPVTITLTAK